jgi:hypothetical protein
MPSGILDNLTQMQAVIQSDHAYIHLGKGYILCITSGSIAAAGVEHISFKTPPVTSGKVIHFRPAAFSSRANSLSVTMTEGAVMTDGTLQTPQNLNRFKANQSKVEARTGATLTTAGTGGVIFDEEVGTGGASNRSGGGSGSQEERLLKPDTMYSITMTNTGSSTATVAKLSLFWYEE